MSSDSDPFAVLRKRLRTGAAKSAGGAKRSRPASSAIRRKARPPASVRKAAHDKLKLFFLSFSTLFYFCFTLSHLCCVIYRLIEDLLRFARPPKACAGCLHQRLPLPRLAVAFLCQPALPCHLDLRSERALPRRCCPPPVCALDFSCVFA